ncbi:glycoside hydrolase family 35 protein [Thermothielavioides terrestris NRRL 8126]|uniref:beta-galactosidase n=1 Tax=Thermothielavioides terrestris (strain ATCC 38088 / NRRL 8126) TaxID=578455 RepID=G2R540_THETT|nr:glycoside hydrolase family 35 protein [Thermothielavioides terrestris NRRL 8126]AEO65317.1 glycoside hydrolase family 35 protein [Thermothielavioides terrestris NRRL 8126]
MRLRLALLLLTSTAVVLCRHIFSSSSSSSPSSSSSHLPSSEFNPLSILPRLISRPSTPPSANPQPNPEPNPNQNRNEKLPPRADATYAPPTWDNATLVLLGQRAMLFGGEFHPFRLPVPALWSDVLEKMRAAGLNAVSFYVPWALLEGRPGEVRAEGVFDVAAFCRAAAEVGLWLVARPGPYINGEVTGGGLPGWIQRLRGHPRTSDADYLAATNNYAANVGAIIAKAQINNGGKVILYQPENEYSVSRTLIGFNFPDPGYMQYVEDQARRAGVVVPFMNNDAWSAGHNAPGTGVGQVDIYGHDLAPLDPDCDDMAWEKGALRETQYANHLNVSASTPYAIPDGGVLDYWGGTGFARCAERFNAEQARVFNKNNFAAGVKIFSLYMMYGGTNWGNLGYDSGYTSYDYAAAIAEDRTLTREKYSEIKLQANFFKVSPGYLVATPDLKPTTGVYSPGHEDITVTAVVGPQGSFYVARKTAYRDASPVNFTLRLPTASKGAVTIPHLGGALTMPGRDSRIYVTDYPVGAMTLVYCTAEIFTWQKFDNGQTVAVLYGGVVGETHELLLQRGGADLQATVTRSPEVRTSLEGQFVYAQWTTTGDRQFVRVGNTYIYLVDRNAAYNYWVADTPGQPPLIVNGGYLIRSAALANGTLTIRGDFNRTTTLELIGVPQAATSLVINTTPTPHRADDDGHWLAQIAYSPPSITLPDLSAVAWSYIDTLPERQSSFSDAAWPSANHTFTNNTYLQAPQTPTSLYASDYTFHAGGALLFRGHFTATGGESAVTLHTQGGRAYAAAVWLDDEFLGGWAGNSSASSHRDTFAVRLVPGRAYALTVLLDNMGNAQNALVGGDDMKAPRGILQFNFTMGGGGAAPAVDWKVTGNLGGEDYVDKARGPLNEGGLWAERQGFHLPGAPTSSGGWTAGSSPMKGIGEPGVGFWRAEAELDIPGEQWDVPLSFEFPPIDTTGAQGRYRAVLWVNGFQFGRYISHIGPQTSVPVPEGILNYHGTNTIAVALWALQPGGARIPSLSLRAGTPVLTGRRPVVGVAAPAWTQRPGAY